MTLRSNAAGWGRDQFGTSTSAGVEKSRLSPVEETGMQA